MFSRYALYGCLLSATCVLAAWTPTSAFQPVVPSQRASQPKLARPFLATDLDVQAELEATTNLAPVMPEHPEAAAFLQRYGGAWEMRWDRRNDRPNLIQGSGIPLIPGRGNTLTMSQIGLAANAAVDLAAVEASLLDFIDENRDLLKTRGLEFRLDSNSSVAYGKDHWFIEFEQIKDDVRVDGASLYFRIAAGNIIQFGANEIAPVAIDVRSVSTRDVAFDLALREIDFPSGTSVRTLIEPGELLLMPTMPAGEAAHQQYLGMAGEGYAHRLIWRFVFRANDDPTTYQVRLDAHSNRVLDVKDLNDYVDATVTGGIYPITNTDTEVVVPMPYATVANGDTKITDALGIYDYSGGTATVALSGKYFAMNDTCGAIGLSSSTDGNLNLGTSGGTDCTTPGVGGPGNTHASRSGFYHLTNINRKASTFFPDNPWVQGTVTANMNLDQTCNAYWNGTAVNFFKSGGGCSNTGELAGIFLHEWGHGMDQNSGGAANENGTGEALGDTFAFLETKDACIGNNFFPEVPCHNCPATCTGARDVSAFSSLGSGTIAMPSTITDDGGPDCDRFTCPYLSQGVFPYQGPMGYEGHCESYIASSANWDLSQKLVDRFGTDQGWGEMDRIWYGSLVPSKSAYRVTSGGQCNASAEVDGCGANNWYTVFLAADDDDGDLTNGTPNGCRIYDAFAAHGIACGTRPVCTDDVSDFRLAIEPASQSVCAPGSANYTIEVSSHLGYANPVTLSAIALPAGVSASFSPNPVTPGGSSTMTVSADSSVIPGASTLTVSGTGTDSDGHSVTTEVVLTADAPVAPSLSGPADGAIDVDTSLILSWFAGSDATSYTLEIATDAAFATIVQRLPGLTATSYAVNGLSQTTTYYWRVTATNICGATASVPSSFMTANQICHSPGLAIPDNDANGVSDAIVISDKSTLNSLRLRIKATHTYVGDLQFTLTRGAGSSMTIDRPGMTSSGYGCSGDNIDVLLDDLAPTGAEDQCNSTPPAISGTQQPNNPIDAVFAGQSYAGTWTLTAADRAAGETGTFDEWCLLPQTTNGTYTVGGAVAGLVGTGLVLSLNAGAQTQAISANGSFAFPDGLPSGTAYVVTVAAQPTEPNQVCAATNANGTIGIANVTSIAVTCGDTIFDDGFEQ